MEKVFSRSQTKMARPATLRSPRIAASVRLTSTVPTRFAPSSAAVRTTACLNSPRRSASTSPAVRKRLI
nr:hypothetical protein [uncultured Acetatifactor sp.]